MDHSKVRRRARPTGAARAVLCGSVLAVVASAAVARADFEPPIAITNARLVNGTGQVTASVTIVIRDGRFESVGADAEIPANAEVIDASGLVAYPGFIDAHSHAGMPEIDRSVADRRLVEDEAPDYSDNAHPAMERANRRGVHPEYRAWKHVDVSDEAFDPYRAAGFSTALVSPKSGTLGGYGAMMSLSGLPSRRATIEAEAAMQASFASGEPGDYPARLLGVFAQLRQVVADAKWHAQAQAYVQRHPRATTRVPVDPALDALQPVLRGAVPVVFEADTENEIVRVLDLAEELKLAVIISGAREAHKVVDRIAAARVPLIVSLKLDDEPEFGKKRPTTQPATRAKFRGEFDEARYLPLRVREELRRRWDERLRNVITLHEHGVRFAFTTRGCDGPGEFMKNLHRVIEAGLPAEAAIRALTVVPAEMFKMDRQVGAVEAGYLANLSLRTAPLSEKESEPRWLFVEGKKFDVRPLVETDKTSKETEVDATSSEPDSLRENAGLQWRCEVEADRAPATRTGGNVLITNANVLTGTGETIENTDILVAFGKIEQIGTGREAPAGVKTIDVNGGWVMPGIIDAHSHTAIDVSNESSRSVVAEVRVADVIDPRQPAIYRALAGGVTTIHTMHGSTDPIGGQNAILKLKLGRPASEMLFREAPRTLKFALGENVTEAGSAERAGNRFPDTRMGVERVIRHAFIAAGQYQAEWDAYRERTARGEDVLPPRTDLRLEALAEVLAGDLAIHCHCYRADEILRMIAVAEAFGVRIGTLHHGLEAYRIAPEIARHGCGVCTFADLWAYKLEAFNATRYNAALLTEHGVCTSVKSDSDNRMRYLNLEAAKCMRWGGLSEADALKLITLNPARQLGIADRVGTIAPGKDADLAIFNGHPLNIYAKCIMTLIEGEVYFEHPSPWPHALTGPVQRVAEVERSIPQSPHQLYAIVGATVHPITAPPIEDATVLIGNRTIREVGTDVSIPPRTSVIRGNGLHVYPGLIDAGSYLGLVEIDALRVSVDRRDIGRFQPDLRAASAFNPHSVHIAIARAEGITAVLSKPTGGVVSGQSALLQLDGWTTPEMTLRDPLALHVSLPVLPLDVPKEDREERFEKHEKQMRETDEFFRRARQYAQCLALAESGSASPPPVDPVLESMRPYVLGQAAVVFEASMFKEIAKAIEFAERHRLRCVVSGGDQAWKLADTLAEKGIPVILTKPSDYPASEFEPWDSVFACASVLAESGVQFCFGSGRASTTVNLPFEAGLAVAHGLSPERALQALTIDAARILGVADQVGSIDPGKLASVIVTTGDPLQPQTEVTHVFIAGVPVDLGNKHRADYAKFRGRPAPKLPPPRELRGPSMLTVGGR